MKYDFDRLIDRTQTNDMKWHPKAVESYLHVPVPEDIIPMWLADMDFACPPGLVEAMKERCDKEIFGYCAPMDSFYKAVMFWQKSQFDVDVQPEWIGTLPTVVAGINVAIRAFSDEGDGIIIQQPVYDPFATIVKRCGRKVVNNALKSQDNYYTMDFELLEKQAQDPANKLMILCSPHNPVGRVWKKEELEKVAEICLRNNVLLVVDEIHADFTLYGNKNYSMLGLKQEYKDNLIVFTSPGKTFNVAGLKIAVSLIPNSELKKKFEEMILNLSLDIRNTFGLEAIAHCYKEENIEWVNQMKAYIQENIDFTYEFVRDHLPGVTFRKPEGTYLVWLDFSGVGMGDQELIKQMLLATGVICVPGVWFGPGGEQHIRFNTACPRSIVEKALKRFEEAIKEGGKQNGQPK